MVIRCLIKGFNSTEDSNNLHRIPKVEERKARWLNIIKGHTRIPVTSETKNYLLYLCRMHFCQNQYPAIRTGTRNVLKPNSIPCKVVGDILSPSTCLSVYVTPGKFKNMRMMTLKVFYI